MKALGRHILVEYYDCNPQVLNNQQAIEQHMVNAAIATGSTVVNSSFHHFSPQGVSGVVVIAESHLAIHTWPEYNYAAVDLFTCGDTVNPWEAYEYLREKLEAKRGDTQEIARGLLKLPQGVELHHKPPVAVSLNDY